MKNLTINLFPLWMQQRQQRKRLVKWLVLWQVVAFFMVIGIVMGVTMLDNRVNNDSALLAQRLLSADVSVIETAEKARELYALNAQAVNSIAMRFVHSFDPLQVENAVVIKPNNVRLITIEWHSANIILIAQADCFSYIALHQEMLREANVFDNVLMGTVTQYESFVQYTLRLIVFDDDNHA